MTPAITCWVIKTCPPASAGFRFLEIGEDGEHPAVIARGLGEVELGEDALHVLFDRSDREDKRLGDPGVRATLGHQ